MILVTPGQLRAEKYYMEVSRNGGSGYGSVVRSTYSSGSEPQLSCQHPGQVAYNRPLTIPVLDEPMEFSGSCRPAHMETWLKNKIKI